MKLAFLVSWVCHAAVLVAFYRIESSSEVVIPLSFAPVEVGSGRERPAPVSGRRVEQAKRSGGPSRAGAPLASASGVLSSVEAAVKTVADLALHGNKLPSYPPLARARGWEGDVRVKVTFGSTVNVVELIESSGYELLDQEVIEKARLWHVSGSDSVQTAWIVPVEFRLRKKN